MSKKIALLGAPGAGKTKLAYDLSAATNLCRIDDYVSAVEDEFNFKADRWATYAMNLAIALRRFRIEHELHSYIICGTVVDTATYMAAEVTLTHEPDHEGWQRRSVASLATIGCMVDDFWSYDYAFYLPLTEEPEDAYHATINKELPTALRLFELPHVILDQPTPEDRLTAALDTINAATE